MNQFGTGTGQPKVSVVIPVYNGAKTIGSVLDAVYKSTYANFEVIAVNDCSTDNCAEVLEKYAARYPLVLETFDENRGVSRARNTGAARARGDILLFIDADCIVLPDTIERAVERLGRGDSICVGGAYTSDPWDDDFFSTFQSLYVHHVETKTEHPDYIATHCMAIRREDFNRYGGFVEDSFIGHEASVEDVEFCHRLIADGHQLARPSDIQVQHMFRFSFLKSIRNAIKKSKYWTMYSLVNKDVTKDSGAASYELKTDVATQVINLCLVIAAVASGIWWLLLPVAFLYGVNLAVSYRLLALIRRERGWWFLVRAMAYFQFVYPYIVAYGSFVGTVKYFWEVKLRHRYS